MAPYPHNTGGIIQALLALEAALSGGGSGGSAVSISMTAGEALTAGDAVYINTTDSKIYKAENDDTREKATVMGFVNADAALDAGEKSLDRRDDKRRAGTGADLAQSIFDVPAAAE